MVKIKKDMEIAQHIDQCDSDLLHETDESFKYLLESDRSVPEQTPKVTVWCIHHVRVMSLLLPVVMTKEANGKKCQMAMTSGPRPLSIQWVARA